MPLLAQHLQHGQTCQLHHILTATTENTLIWLEHIQERKWLEIGCKYVFDKWKYNGPLLCRGCRLFFFFFY